MKNKTFSKIYWGIVRLRRQDPIMLYDRGRDAQRACNRWNLNNKDPIYRVKRYHMHFKGSVVDTYEHIRETHHLDPFKAGMKLHYVKQKPITMTRREWNRIRVGSILVSPNGTLRKVVRGGRGMSVTFTKIGYSRFKGDTTTYVWTDLCHTYRIKKY